MKNNPFQKVTEGIRIQLGAVQSITMPLQSSLVLDDVAGAKVYITIQNGKLKLKAFAPEMPDGAGYEFHTDNDDTDRYPASLEAMVSTIRCEANGKL